MIKREEFLVSGELKREGYDDGKITEELIRKEKPVLDLVLGVLVEQIYFFKNLLFIP